MRYFKTGSIECIGFDFYCDIANQIADARKRKGWTQEQLAEASGISLSRISNMEGVRTKIKLKDLEKLATCLDVTINRLIQAEIDSQIGECLYLVWPESLPDFKLYQKSTSKRMAFLEYEKKMNEIKVAASSPRERVFVELVGTPVLESEIRDRFPALTSDEEPIYKDE